MDVGSGPSLAAWFLITYISEVRGESAMCKFLHDCVYEIDQKSSAVPMILLLLAGRGGLLPTGEVTRGSWNSTSTASVPYGEYNISTLTSLGVLRCDEEYCACAS